MTWQYLFHKTTLGMRFLIGIISSSRITLLQTVTVKKKFQSHGHNLTVNVQFL